MLLEAAGLLGRNLGTFLGVELIPVKKMETNIGKDFYRGR